MFLQLAEPLWLYFACPAHCHPLGAREGVCAHAWAGICYAFFYGVSVGLMLSLYTVYTQCFPIPRRKRPLLALSGLTQFGLVNNLELVGI